MLGDFTAHQVVPPKATPLSHALEEWARDLLDKYGTRLNDSGVSGASL